MNKVQRIENVKEVIDRLLGEIEPYGDSDIDEVRLNNLEQTIEVTEKLIDEIIIIASYKDRPEWSMSNMGVTANEFITRLKDKLNL